MFSGGWCKDTVPNITDSKWKAAGLTPAFPCLCQNPTRPPVHRRERYPYIEDHTARVQRRARLGGSTLPSLHRPPASSLQQNMVLTVSGAILSPPVLNTVLCCPFLFAFPYSAFCYLLLLDSVLETSLSLGTSKQEDLFFFFRPPIIPQSSCIMLHLF